MQLVPAIVPEQLASVVWTAPPLTYRLITYPSTAWPLDSVPAAQVTVIVCPGAPVAVGVAPWLTVAPEAAPWLVALAAAVQIAQAVTAPAARTTLTSAATNLRLRLRDIYGPAVR